MQGHLTALWSSFTNQTQEKSYKSQARICYSHSTLQSNITSKTRLQIMLECKKITVILLPNLRGLLQRCQFHGHCGTGCSTAKAIAPLEFPHLKTCVSHQSVTTTLRNSTNPMAQWSWNNILHSNKFNLVRDAFEMKQMAVLCTTAIITSDYFLHNFSKCIWLLTCCTILYFYQNFPSMWMHLLWEINTFVSCMETFIITKKLFFCKILFPIKVVFCWWKFCC
jgi:hypothetical protein